MIFIPSFGGAEEVSVGKSIYFGFWMPWDRSLLLKFLGDQSLMIGGSILEASFVKNAGIVAALPSKSSPKRNVNLKTTFFCSRKTLYTSTNHPKSLFT